MRFITYLLLSMAMTFSITSYADISSGVFRFQSKLAEQGNSEAQYKVGEMYEMGKGAAQDQDKAQIWFEKSAKQGYKKAEYKLLYNEMSANGLNDYTKSQLAKVRKEAALGIPDAQYYLGKMYASGVGVPKSLNNALTWLNKATFNGVSEAEFEAIAVEEELNRIRARESRRRAIALAESKKKKADEEKARRAKVAKDRALAEKRDKQRRLEAKANAESKRKARELRESALLKEKEKSRRNVAEPKKAAVKSSEDDEKSSFESDPCKGNKARFLSTCK